LEHQSIIKIFCFGDVPSWFRNNIPSSYNHKIEIIYVTGNSKERDYEDLILMSKCNHNIISYSTFSWWGAWLNTSENKIVCSPKKDYFDNKDIIPNQWNIIEDN
jgi:hypothetical protein